ncbi:hypothetical protein ASPCAL02669 [Aspergillus calidoustus]|uniref:Uncharacterized protein n=1 Tax=Aspergillus calidoustus TaxID=454130 RepID=A0A0U5CN42_ASPCI|nr:hypothetical protein ASPCAL02669 [Aspergillus calidoustus]
MGLHGMNVSVLAGWCTFSNLGPLATTYTPSPQCTASDQMYIGNVNPTAGNVLLNWAHPRLPRRSFTGTSNEEYEDWESSQISWEGYGEYYSPGVECPSGWATVGMIGRNGAGDKVTSSGILSPATTTTVTRYTTGIDMYYYDYEDKASVMKSFLEPEQTMAICCPSGMTADNRDACYSVVKDYKPTYGCLVHTGENYDYGEVTTTYLDPIDNTMATVTYDTPTATRTTVETNTYHLDRDEQALYSGLMYAPAITLLYHESDLQSAATTAAASAANSDDDGNDTTESEATPSNAAGRLGLSVSVWDGIGPVIGIWIIAAALGAAIVLPL